MKVCLLAPSAAGNALGRAYSLWLVARHLGWEAKVLAPDVATIWAPLADEREFVGDVTDDEALATMDAAVLLVVKPLPGSFDRGLDLRRRLAIPLVLDVDDPDWERAYGETAGAKAGSFLKLSLRLRPPVNAFRLRRRARREQHVAVSNPAMRRWYPRSALLPHARVVRPAGRAHEDRQSLDVAFVGTVRPHKGMTTLREAVRRVGNATLTVTAAPPRDAMPHEHWVGATGVAEGWGLVDRCDVVAVVSSPTIYGRGQLPVKLIDGMLSGRAVVASDLEPLRWALGDTGLIVPPDDADALVRALEELRPAERRSQLGERARERARGLFSVEAVGEALSQLVDSAVR